MSTSLITWVPKVDETMIAFDPSLANTGWVLVRMGRAIDQGVIKTPPSDTGIRGNLERSETIYSEVAFLLKTYVPVYVACELPAVQGYRIDAALLSSQAIYLASAHTLNVVPRLINSQHVKKRITGNARASKGELKGSVSKLLPDLCDRKPYNEHVADAGAISVVALMEVLDEE